MPIQLTAEQVRLINQERRNLTDALNDTAKLIACDVPCEQRKQEIESMLSKMNALIEHFAPQGS